AVWVWRTTLAGWGSFAIAGWSYSVAQPTTHKIDDFFGVVRSQSWDRQAITVAVLFAALSLILAGAALLLVAIQPRNGPTASPRSAQVLGVVVFAAILCGLIGISRP